MRSTTGQRPQAATSLATEIATDWTRLAAEPSLLRDRASVRKLVEDAQVAWAGITVRLAGCREQMGGLALDRSLLADVADLGLALDVQVSAE